jgi:hypothetical protein
VARRLHRRPAGVTLAKVYPRSRAQAVSDG